MNTIQTQNSFQEMNYEEIQIVDAGGLVGAVAMGCIGGVIGTVVGSFSRDQYNGPTKGAYSGAIIGASIGLFFPI